MKIDLASAASLGLTKDVNSRILLMASIRVEDLLVGGRSKAKSWHFARYCCNQSPESTRVHLGWIRKVERVTLSRERRQAATGTHRELGCFLGELSRSIFDPGAIYDEGLRGEGQDRDLVAVLETRVRTLDRPVKVLSELRANNLSWSLRFRFGCLK